VSGGAQQHWPGRTGRVLFIQHQDECPPGHVGHRLTERGARVEVVRADASRLPDPTPFDLIVPLGSYESAHDTSVPYVDSEAELLATAVHAGIPVFGICFGAQLLSRVLGGLVQPASDGPEIGWLDLDTRVDEQGQGHHGSPGDRTLVEPGPWLVWHVDVMTAPPGAWELARTGVGTQAFVHGPHVGVQFHPEALPHSIEAWTRDYRQMLLDQGTDPERFLAQSHRGARQARRRGRALADRVVDRMATAPERPRVTAD
jgi:GMP synthase (glutamine-hydrolysing)